MSKGRRARVAAASAVTRIPHIVEQVGGKTMLRLPPRVTSQKRPSRVYGPSATLAQQVAHATQVGNDIEHAALEGHRGQS